MLPSLALNYFGQGALLLSNPAALENPFFLLAPEWFRLPLVVLATAATIIASQAMISGAYSIARQCVQLGFSPRLEVRHTSETEEGQIYLPQVNFALLAGVVILVLAFRSSDSLAAAYGIAVTGTFVAPPAWRCWCSTGSSAGRCCSPSACSGRCCCSTSCSSLPMAEDPGWRLCAAGARRDPDGADEHLVPRPAIAVRPVRQDSLPLKSFLARLPQSRTIRVPGIAVFMTSQADYVPGALLHNLKHNKVLHERVLFVTVLNEDVPQVATDRRRDVQELAPGIHRVTLRYGFQESPHIPRDLESLREVGCRSRPCSPAISWGGRRWCRRWCRRCRAGGSGCSP